jgi:DNA polymerase-3 subunit alpha
MIVTGYDMDSITSVGLLKMDILGLKTLSVIETCLKQIQINHNKDVRGESTTLDDIEVFKLFTQGKTAGIFQFESAGMRDLCKRTRPSKIEDLMALNALYRPGPLGSGMVDLYIARKNGKAFIHEHPALEPILTETYGVFVYQEQIMQMAHVLAGFSLAEGDMLRKAMAKKDIKTLQKITPRFLEGAQKLGVSTNLAQRIIEVLEPFADYCFNKPHSASYALLSYQTAWLKVHYPIEYMAACLTSEIGDSDKLAEYIAETRSMGIKVFYPDINTSYTGFKALSDGISYGLMGIKGVGEGAVDYIIQKRDKPFTSLTDFCYRTMNASINKKTMESLITAGAFDSLGLERSEYLQILPTATSIASKLTKEQTTGQVSFLAPQDDDREMDLSDTRPIGIAPWTKIEKLEHEKEIFGFYLTGHPYEDAFNSIRLLAKDYSDNIGSLPEGQSVKTGGVVQSVRRILDKRGKEMGFVMIVDEVGTYEMIVFSSLFANVKHKLVPEVPVVILGSATSTTGKYPKILAKEIMDVKEANSKIFTQLHIKTLPPDELGSIASLCSPKSQDTFTLIIHVIGEDGKEQIVRAGTSHCIAKDKAEEVVTQLGNTNVWLS